MSRTTTKVIIRHQDGEMMSQYALGIGEHIIGRAEDSQIVINDEYVSRQHARLIISVDAVEIEDLNSTSGTFLDGMNVSGRIPVMPDQRVTISDLCLDIERAGFGEIIKGARLGEGRFTLIEKLGQGGMGAVWKALDEEMGEHVALKLLPAEMSFNLSGLLDLEREVEKTINLKHPNIVQIGGLWHVESEPAFITLEIVEGTDLEVLRLQSPGEVLAWGQVQNYMLQLCNALEYAHYQKIAHRDIKPSNLLISRSGELKLADFGIAASLSGTPGKHTIDVLGAGSPPYMSPQQIRGERPQPADDIYSLGSTFYELLTSTPPFYEGDIMSQVPQTPVDSMDVRLRKLGLSNNIPDYVSAMVMACLQKDPDKRPANTAVIRKWIETEGREARLTDGKRILWGEIFTGQAAPNPDNKPLIRNRKKTGKKRSNILVYGIFAMTIAAILGAIVFWPDPSPPPGPPGAPPSANPKISKKPTSPNNTPGTLFWRVATGSSPSPLASNPSLSDDGSIFIGSGDNKVYALHANNGTKKWEYATGGPVNSSPAVGLNDIIYVGSNDKHVYALDKNSGAEVWKFETKGAVISSPAIGQNHNVYVGSSDNNIYALDGNTGVRLWARMTAGTVNASPSIGIDGTVYVGSSDRKFYALNGETGAKKWEFETEGTVTSSPSIGTDGTVYFGASDSKIYALSGITGIKKWEFKTKGPVLSSAAIGQDGTIYIGSTDNNIYALNGKSGAKIWETPTGGPIFSSPTLGANDTVYIGSYDKKIYALYGNNGTKKWELKVKDKVSSSPAIGTNGKIYSKAHDGSTYCIFGEAQNPAVNPWAMFGQNPQHSGRRHGKEPQEIPLSLTKSTDKTKQRWKYLLSLTRQNIWPPSGTIEQKFGKPDNIEKSLSINVRKFLDGGKFRQIRVPSPTPQERISGSVLTHRWDYFNDPDGAKSIRLYFRQQTSQLIGVEWFEFGRN